MEEEITAEKHSAEKNIGKEISEEKIFAQDLLDEVKSAVRDIWLATVHKYNDEIQINFLNGQSFTLAIWENKSASVK